MKMRHPAIACSILALSACGESAAPTPTPPAGGTPPPPPPTAVKTSGVITGFGSIIVNGERYETDDGTIVAVEDEPETTGDDSRLRLGMRVEIDGTETDGVRTAGRIEYDEELRGPAENITPNTENPEFGTFTIAGQTVIIDANTVLDDDFNNVDGVAGVDIRDLNPALLPGGDPVVVEVSGYPTETGVIATRVENTGEDVDDIGREGVDGDEIEVKGYVDDVASGGGSITVNTTEFLVTSSTVLEDDLVVGDSLIGAFVEIKADINSMSQYIAVEIESEEDDLDDAAEDDEIDLEGVLQAVDTVADPDVIVVNGVEVAVDDASAFIGLVGARVSISGTYNGDGVLVVSESDFEADNTIGTVDRIASVDTAGGTFTTRLGLVITPTIMSRVEDEVGADGDQLTPADFLSRLRANDYVEARGYPGENGAIVWTRIEREDDDDQGCELRGPVDTGTIADPTFEILGVSVNTTGLGDNGFREEGMSLGRSDFFSDLLAGDIVSVESDDAGTGCRDGEIATMTDGEVTFDPENDVAGTRSDDDVSDDTDDSGDDEIAGTVRRLDTGASTFEIGSLLITVTQETTFDADLVSRARGEQVTDGDYPLSQIPETLGQLLSNGDVVAAEVDAEGNAISIDDA